MDRDPRDPDDLGSGEDLPDRDPLDAEVPMSEVDVRGVESAAERPDEIAYAGDGGDLYREPASGDTDDPLVAIEEGVPYVPPSDRVLSPVREDQGGPDMAGTAANDAGELGRADAVQPPAGEEEPRDGELLADVLEALRASEIAAGERLNVSVRGGVVRVRGEVESVDILDEVLAVVGDVEGVHDVVDEVSITGV